VCGGRFDELILRQLLTSQSHNVDVAMS